MSSWNANPVVVQYQPQSQPQYHHSQPQYHRQAQPQPGRHLDIRFDTSSSAHPSLSFLEKLDAIVITQKVDLVEVCFGCDRNKKYLVLSRAGEALLLAVEETPCSSRACLGSSRGFNLMIFDGHEIPVMSVQRPVDISHLFCGCTSKAVEVESPPGNLIGRIRKVCTFFNPMYEVFDATFPLTPVFSIEGPACRCPCCPGKGFEFKIYFHNAMEMEVVGFISKEWGGIMKEMFTKADTFACNFPLNLDIRLKAILLGAIFMIDFIHFEKNLDTSAVAVD